MLSVKRAVRVGSGAVLSMLALASWSPPAAACGACVCNDEPMPILTLIRDLPLNLAVPLRVLDESESPPRLELVSNDMVLPVPAPVPAKVERIAGGPWLLTVEQDLEALSEYRIVRDTGIEAQFSTGTERDTDAPKLNGASSTPGGNAALCDASVGAHLTLDGADDSAFHVWVELEVDVNGTANTLFLDYSPEIAIGHSAMGCLGFHELPGLEGGTGYPSRVRLHDAGGNVSEWQTLIVNVAAEQPGSCGTPTTTAGANSVGGGGATNSSGTGATTALGGTSNAPEDDDATRTSKGCGCALGERQRKSFAATTLLACMLAAAALRRQLRL